MAHHSGNTLPPLLEDFARWLETREHFALGDFELSRAPVDEAWFEDAAAGATLTRSATGFLRTFDGSQVILVDPGAGAPLAIVLLDSEGEFRTIASSPEEFLSLLATATTGVFELDDETTPGWRWTRPRPCSTGSSGPG